MTSITIAANTDVPGASTGAIVTWTPRESGTQDSLARVVSDQTRFVAIGGSSLLTSSDGINWTKHNAPASLYDIAAGNNLLVAIANPSGTGQPYRLLASQRNHPTAGVKAGCISP